ncbi:hypothetical protein [Anoxybacter fermentans]|nr:hypothetical protein [Anoxybacter fermentans]
MHGPVPPDPIDRIQDIIDQQFIDWIEAERIKMEMEREKQGQKQKVEVA